ncbi:hypothetical protein Tco_1122417 [Tanacetum coccineum]|uniref:Uncharacterized protein n=1 Tax=Tanacetum coccineum TaxID=301880 RepID=A0ABQ5J2T4_9ASTR
MTFENSDECGESTQNSELIQRLHTVVLMKKLLKTVIGINNDDIDEEDVGKSSSMKPLRESKLLESGNHFEQFLVEL